MRYNRPPVTPSVPWFPFFSQVKMYSGTSKPSCEATTLHPRTRKRRHLPKLASRRSGETLRRGLARVSSKNKLLSLAPDDMEELVAAVLRALGYKARVTPKGPDRGRDVIASPDGLGFQSPRVIAEVKHRPKEPIGANTVRGFLGGLREGDRGLFVSTGGFTREANYEAERASFPVTLVDLDQLATLVVEHYENFDLDGRIWSRSSVVYWPVA